MNCPDCREKIRMIKMDGYLHPIYKCPKCKLEIEEDEED